ncbi:KilA-N domain-containing protein [Oceanisphaera sp. KMM 10153]|uniref:KilA-N domain-containing protein n=1 Tax=Oceanisphaera submarina TaxID=3390193 RepID=UPI0039762C3B
MKELILCNQKVKVAEDGMVSLTDMWKAAGGKNKDRPKYFLKNDRTVAFVDELTKGENPPLRITKGGSESGTWGCKYLAYKYAAWIDPAFEVGVYRILDQFFSGELQSRPHRELHDFLLKERVSVDMGSLAGRALRIRRIEKTELEQERGRLEHKYQLQITY